MPTVTKYAPGTPCWVDLASPDLAASTAFYSSLFGWEAHDQGPDAGHYHMLELGGVPVAGAGPIMMEGQPSAWLTYVSVEDADRDDRQGQGGRRHGLRRADGRARRRPHGVFADPTGAAAAVWQPRLHPGAGRGQRARERSPGTSSAPAIPSTAAKLLPRHLRVGSETPTRWVTWSTPSGSSEANTIGGMMAMPAEVPARGAVLLADLLRHRRLRCHGGHRHRSRAPPCPCRRWTSLPGRFAILADPTGAMFAVFALAAG